MKKKLYSPPESTVERIRLEHCLLTSTQQQQQANSELEEYYYEELDME